MFVGGGQLKSILFLVDSFAKELVTMGTTAVRVIRVIVFVI